MIDLTRDIQSLTDFKRRTGAFLRQMKRSGHPLVLTVNGKAELVVQDAEAYQGFLDLLERADAIAGIRRGLEAFQRGRGRPAREALEGIRRKHALPR